MKSKDLRPDTPYIHRLRDAADGNTVHLVILCRTETGDPDLRLWEVQGDAYRLASEAKRPAPAQGIGILAIELGSVPERHLTRPEKRSHLDKLASMLQTLPQSPLIKAHSLLDPDCPIDMGSWLLIAPNELVGPWGGLAATSHSNPRLAAAPREI